MGTGWPQLAARGPAILWAGFWTWFGLALGISERLPPLGVLLHTMAPGERSETKEMARITGLPETTVAGRRTQFLPIFDTRSIFEAAQKAREQGIR